MEGGDYMTLDELETVLDDALVKLSNDSKDTNDLICENASLSKVVDNVYESVFKCFDNFKGAIIDYEKQKN